jgi:RNAse (barnase) inhibitor barstar
MKNPFEFTEPSDDNNASADSFVLRVPPGIRSKADLLQALATAGRFPDYFGNNWDALLDCLCDFGWVREKQIVITHSDVPLRAHPGECRTYLEILREAHNDWAGSSGHSKDAAARDLFPDHELRVQFPRFEQSSILNLLSS